jgi:hypothetical protein
MMARPIIADKMVVAATTRANPGLRSPFRTHPG